MDLRDHGLGQGLDARHQTGAAFEQVLEAGDTPILGVAQRGHLLQIMSGAERFACPGKDDDPYIGTMRDLVQTRLQRGQHLVRQRVQPVRRVHRQPDYRTVTCHFDHCHLEPLPLFPEPSRDI